MSIPSVNSASSNPYVSTLADDFKSLQTTAQAYKKAKSSGSQDQITISQDALNKAMTQFQTDIAGVSQGSQGANGHHRHHHHHGINAAGSSGNTTTDNPGASTASTAAYSDTQSQNVSSVNLTA